MFFQGWFAQGSTVMGMFKINLLSFFGKKNNKTVAPIDPQLSDSSPEVIAQDPIMGVVYDADIKKPDIIDVVEETASWKRTALFIAGSSMLGICISWVLFSLFLSQDLATVQSSSTIMSIQGRSEITSDTYQTQKEVPHSVVALTSEEVIEPKKIVSTLDQASAGPKLDPVSDKPYSSETQKPETVASPAQTSSDELAADMKALEKVSEISGQVSHTPEKVENPVDVTNGNVQPPGETPAANDQQKTPPVEEETPKVMLNESQSKPEPDTIEKSEEGSPEKKSSVDALELPAAVKDTSATSQEAENPPFKRNAQSIVKSANPKIALVVVGLGLDKKVTTRALTELPKEISVAFVPYAAQVSQQIEDARKDTREVMLTLPLEPIDYPKVDPGPLTLLTGVDEAENIQKLDKILMHADKTVGVVAFMGARFLTSKADLFPVLDTLKTRGFLFLDNRSTARSAVEPLAQRLSLAFTKNSRFLDEELSRGNIIQNLHELEEMARKDGKAVGIAFAYDLTLDVLVEWVKTLAENKIDLIPITAMLDQDKDAEK